ncbi:hypothetical protein ACOMHN_015687 [Nucella lapillus]
MDFGILRAVKTLKNHPYVQYVGLGFAGLVQKTAGTDPQDVDATGKPQRKTKLQLIRLSAAVCGIELCYAAETAFVSPILLKLGVPVSLMTLVWCLSPVLGFFLVPVMGSLSDRCPLRLGRRRPFILAMSVGIVVGLVFVPNGEALGLWMGDNGTATLHHPKFFAPFNLSLTPKTANKRSSLVTPFPLHRGSAVPQKYLYDYLTLAEQEEVNDEDFNLTESEFYDVVDGDLEREYPFLEKVFYEGGGGKNNNVSSHSRDLLDSLGRIISRTRKYKIQTRGHSQPHKTDGNVRSKFRNKRDESDEEDEGDKDDDDSSSKPLSVFQLSEEHFRGIILTILGVALLDFNCDACQSPCRAYLLDVSIPEDHSSGLTMFTVMAGLGGTVGYVMGGIDWNSTSFGEAFGGHIRVVFTLVIVVFIFCVASTLASFKETPLHELGYNEEQLQKKKKKIGKSKYRKFTNEDSDDDDFTEGRTIDNSFPANYGSVTHTDDTSLDMNDPFSPGLPDVTQGTDDTMTFYHAHDPSFTKPFSMNGTTSTDMPNADRGLPPGHQNHTTTHHGDNLFTTSDPTKPDSLSLDLPPQPDPIEISADVTLRTYLKSILHMPRCLWVLCVVNLFCWMSLVCYSLYFTDFVGQAVFMGDPQAPPGSPAHNAYDDGVRLGSFAMALYSLSCSVYSLMIEKLVRRYRAKNVYVTGQLVFTVGMAIMAAARHKVAVVLLSPTAGIMYATLFTMPYLLVAQYHTSGLFSHSSQNKAKQHQVRGLGTDVAIVSSMVFLAQFLLSVAMGTIIYALSSTTTVIVASAVLSSLGAVTATHVTYLDL